MSAHSARKRRTGQPWARPAGVVALPVAPACRTDGEGARRQFRQLAGGAALNREGLPKPGQEGVDACQNGVRGLLVGHMRGTAGQHLGGVPEQAQHLSAPLPVQPRGPAHDPGRMPERIGAEDAPEMERVPRGGRTGPVPEPGKRGMQRDLRDGGPPAGGRPASLPPSRDPRGKEVVRAAREMSQGADGAVHPDAGFESRGARRP